MFYIAKFAWTFLQPSSLIGLVLFAGALLVARGKERLGTRLLLAGAALYAICGLSPLANWLLIPLELRAASSAAHDIEDADGIIVLGGAITGASSMRNKEPRLNEAAERMTEAVRLADRYPSMPVIFTGGKGDLLGDEDEATEAELARRFFMEFKLAPPRLKLEDRSRNTRENAIFTAQLLQPKPGQKWILITSALHMPRAKAHFEAQGFQVLPWPVDFKTSGPGDRWRLFAQASKGLRLMDLAAKEWAGIWVSWLRGDIAWPRYCSVSIDRDLPINLSFSHREKERRYKKQRLIRSSPLPSRLFRPETWVTGVRGRGGHSMIGGSIRYAGDRSCPLARRRSCLYGMGL
jgi:uncharacterized SAM-binding protein YcdF (DUF218 family)